MQAQRFAIYFLTAFLTTPALLAGGPKYVAGTTYFDPAVAGQPVHWAGGMVHYYVDRGPLNSQIDNQQATAMVDAAAALWSAVPTAGVALNNAGPLNEDVSSADVIAGNQTFAAPADVTPSATNYPLAIRLTRTAQSPTTSSAPAQAIRPVARTTASSPGSITSAPKPPSPMLPSCSTASAPRTPTSSK